MKAVADLKARQAAQNEPPMNPEVALTEYWRCALGLADANNDTDGIADIDADELTTILATLSKGVSNLEADAELIRRARDLAKNNDVEGTKIEAEKALRTMERAKVAELEAEAKAHVAYCEASRLETIARNRHQEAIRARVQLRDAVTHLKSVHCPASELPEIAV